jgi:hypothetical protein
VRTICRNTKEYESCTRMHISNAGMFYETVKQVVDIE